MTTVQESVNALNSAGLDKLPLILEELEAQTKRAASLADALANDYRSLEVSLQVQREVTIRLIQKALEPRDSIENPSLSQYRQIEAEIRAEIEKTLCQ